MNKMRPTFKVGLNVLTKFIFEKTRPKKLGSIVMIGLTYSFLDAINIGDVPLLPHLGIVAFNFLA
jgi:hypothetical protein